MELLHLPDEFLILVGIILQASSWRACYSYRGMYCEDQIFPYGKTKRSIKSKKCMYMYKRYVKINETFGLCMIQLIIYIHCIYIIYNNHVAKSEMNMFNKAMYHHSFFIHL